MNGRAAPRRRREAGVAQAERALDEAVERAVYGRPVHVSTISPTMMLSEFEYL